MKKSNANSKSKNNQSSFREKETSENKGGGRKKKWHPPEKNVSPQRKDNRRPFSPKPFDTDFIVVLEGKFGEEGLKKIAAESRRRIQNMLGGEKGVEKTHELPSAAAEVESQPTSQSANTETPTRGFALAQFKAQQKPAALAEPPTSNSIPQKKSDEPKIKNGFAPSRNYSVQQGSPSRNFARHNTPVQNEKPVVTADVKIEKKHAAAEEVTQTFRTPKGLVLDAWQNKAVQALLDNKHIVVDAPTSAGKTRVIEALLEYRMQEGGRLIYTSPVKSLSNDKYREFCEKYGREQVGINTGDFKENLSAPIILATLETYRNSLLGIEPDMRRRVVVYDEYHFLQDESRGSAWEESLILTPKGSQLVLLSASVPNCAEFADWIQKLTGTETEVVQVSKRPVPLEHVVYTKYGWLLCDLLNLQPDELSLLGKIARQKRRTNRWFRGKEAYKEFLDPICNALDMNMGPLVVYAGRRGDTEGVIASLAKHLKTNSRTPESQLKRLQERVTKLSGWEYVPKELQNLVLRYAIAYHHSGMIPPCRVAIETLLKEGLLRLCCGTMGISLGVNFAVRSAFISDESRPSEGGETSYSNTEIMQMLGRAGRRGHDTQGFSLWLNLGRYATQRPRTRENCKSSLKFDPTTVISILGQHKSIAYLSEFYRKSFFMRSQNSEQVFAKDGPLNKIILHLRDVEALVGETPTTMGNLARHFPQAGGFIIAQWIANGTINRDTFEDYLGAMAAFGAAHFKEIPDTYADMKFLTELRIPELIEKYYPQHLFLELYDEVKQGHDVFLVFREFNLGAASLVKMWLNPRTKWEDLVAEHSTKYFSDGDCMNVLFRFATFLQSCARLGDFDPAIAAHAKRLWRILLREPLDARNRMLIEEDFVEEMDAEHNVNSTPV